MKKKITAILLVSLFSIFNLAVCVVMVGCTKVSENNNRNGQNPIVDSQIRHLYKGQYTKDCIESHCTCYHVYPSYMVTCDFYDAIKLE